VGKKKLKQIAYNGRQLGDSSRSVGLQRGGYCAKLRLAAVFLP